MKRTYQPKKRHAQKVHGFRQKATFLLITDWVRFGEKQNLKGK